MGKDFKWLAAVADEKCVMCQKGIKRGESFYFETTAKEIHCRECGRAIKKDGYAQAKANRSIGSLFKSIFGEDFKL